MKSLSSVKGSAFQAHSYWAEDAPSKLILIRHGETDWNVKRRIQGWKGTGLNALGRRQAKLLAERLSRIGLKLDALLSSDLKRSYETALAIGQKLGLKPQKDLSWRERNFGDWEGRSIEQVLAKYRLGPKQRQDPFLAFEPKGGENMTRFAQRIRKAMEAVEVRYHAKTIGIVTHGGPMRIAACLATEIPAKKYFLLGRPGNTALSIIGSQSGISWLERYNDMSHLEPHN